MKKNKEPLQVEVPQEIINNFICETEIAKTYRVKVDEVRYTGEKIFRDYNGLGEYSESFKVHNDKRYYKKGLLHFFWLQLSVADSSVVRTSGSNSKPSLTDYDNRRDRNSNTEELIPYRGSFGSWEKD